MRRSLRAAFDALMAPFLHQDFDRVMQFLGNLGVIAALLASLLFGIVMTIPHEEMVRGDIQHLSLVSPAFRCRFAPNASLEICSASFMDAHAAHTNRQCDWRDAACRSEYCDLLRCMKAREERRASSVAKTEGSSYRVDDASVERVSRSSA